MSRARIALLATVLGVLLSLSAVACTGGGDQEPGPSQSGSPQPSETEAAEVPPDDDGVLRVAVSQPATLDPMRVGDPASVLIARQLFEGLTRWDPVAEEVVPAAAEGWEVKNKGEKWIFTLKQGMTFHDGSPVTAKEFRLAFDRIARRSNASDIAYTLELVDGFARFNQLGEGKHLAGIKTPDEHTIEFTLERPFHDFPAILTHPGLVPVPVDVDDNIDLFLSSPVGNGPFMMAEPWIPGAEVVLERFPGAVETPSIEGIRFVPFADASESWPRFQNGEMDVSEVPVGTFEEAAETYGDRGYKPFLAGYYYGFNLDAKGLGDVRVRRAVNLAIDRDAIATEIYKGNMTPPRGIVPEGMPGFDEDACEGICEFDGDEAKKLARRIPAGKRSLRLEFTRGEPHAKVARMVAANLEEAGFRVSSKGYGFSKYLKLLGKDEHHVFRLGWIAEYPVADVFLTSLFGGGSPDNQTGFDQSKVNKLLARAHAQEDDDERVEFYLRAEREILESVPLIPIGSFQIHWAASERVEQIDWDVMGGFDAVDVRFAAE